ncbi:MULTISPECIES: AMP-binding enzyme, partial [Niastella]
RRDEQVKIRGYRIELGEIESVLQQVAGIQQAVVVIREEAQQHKQLVAYVMSSDRWDKEKAWQYLRSRLPEYMVPSVIVALEELPLTANGKIDRRRLSEWDISADISSNYEAPRNETERSIAAIWQQLLGIDKVSIHDNFFERGGDSIISIQLVNRARRLGYNILPRNVFMHQTIATLAAVITGQLQTKNQHHEQGILSGSSGLLPIQQWFLQQQQDGINHFNQDILLQIDKSITEEELNTVLRFLVTHHDGLRMHYKQNGSEWQQE